MALKVRMNIVVEGEVGDYHFPDDFVPPFLSAPVKQQDVVDIPRPTSPLGDAALDDLTPVLPPVDETPPVEEEPLGNLTLGAPEDFAEAHSPFKEPEAGVTSDYVLTTPKRTQPALIRGLYTFLFTLLGMAGAAFTYLQDNLSQLSDIKWQTIAIVGGGALLAGFLYFLKKFIKPEGTW